MVASTGASFTAVIAMSRVCASELLSPSLQRRGKPQGMDVQDGMQSIKAVVPMAEMLDYATALRSMTQGRASFTMAYSHYEELPKLIQDKVIRDYEREKAEAS